MQSIQICILFLLITFNWSCKGQSGTGDKIESQSQSKTLPAPQPAVDSNDIDPYFVESIDIINSTGPRVITRNVLEDRNGDLWFATWNGIIHYNGSLFTNVTNKEGLRRHRVFSLLEDTKNNLWFGSVLAGVYRYDGKSFTNFTVKNGLIDNKIECLMEDKVGNIWFGTGKGVSRYDGTTFHNFTEDDGLIDADVHSIIQDRTGKIWSGALGGVFVYDGKRFTAFNNSNGQPFHNVRTIIEDRNGDIWIGGQDGLFIYNGRSIEELMTDFTGYLFEDSKGVMWISAGEGGTTRNMVLYRYGIIPFSKQIGNLKFHQIISYNGQIFGITEDRNGDIWFGTTEGVCKYDGEAFNYFR